MIYSVHLHFIISSWFNQIGVYYGNPEVTSGGIALKFFASVRLEIRPIGKIKSVSTKSIQLICALSLSIPVLSDLLLQVKGDEEIGLKVRVRVQKSKVIIFCSIALIEVHNICCWINVLHKPALA